MLKNDTLKNDTSRIGLYGSGPPAMTSKLNEENVLILLRRNHFGNIT